MKTHGFVLLAFLPMALTGICEDSRWTDPETGVVYDLSDKEVVRGPGVLRSIGVLADRIRIRDGILCIRTRAFMGCTNLTEVIIPTSVVQIGDQAFSGCSRLRVVQLSQGLREIGREAFSGCESLFEFKIPQSVIMIGSGAVDGCGELLKQAVKCDGYFVLDGWAMDVWNVGMVEHGSKASLVVLPDSVRGIADSTFSAVEVSDRRWYNGCKNKSSKERCRTSNRFSVGKSVERRDSIDSGATEVWNGGAVRSVVLPKGIRHIGAGAFRETCIEKINLPFGLQTLGECAFASCTNLVGISIPNSLVNWGGRGFKGCTRLEKLTLCDGLKSLPGAEFDDCCSLTSVYIPYSVTNSPCGVFCGCSSLTSFVFATENPYFASRDGVVYTKDLRTLVCCPPGKSSIDEKMIPESVNDIGCDAMYGCSALQEFQIPINVTNVGNCAFRSCSRLTNVGIPEGVASIGVVAFERCRHLEEIRFPKSINKSFDIFGKWGGPERILTARGDAARILSLLYSRSGGTPVYSPRYRVLQDNMLVRKVPENSRRWRDVENGLAWTYRISNGAATLVDVEFLDRSVSKVEIPAFIGDIPLVALACSLPSRNPYLIRGDILAPVLIPASVTNISDKCAESGAMVEVHPENRRFKSVHGSLYDVEMTKLYSYSRTNSVWKIPSSVRVVGTFASCGNTELTAVKLHQGVTEIGYNAFAGCIRLRKFSITPSVTNISTTAFHGCRALQEVTVIEKDGRASFVSIDDIARWGYWAIQNRSAGSTRRSSRRLPPNRNFQR